MQGHVTLAILIRALHDSRTYWKTQVVPRPELDFVLEKLRRRENIIKVRQVTA